MFAPKGAALAGCLFAAVAFADGPDGGAAEDFQFLVRTFDSNKDATEAAPGLSAMMAARFVEAKLKVVSDEDIVRSLGLNRQRELMGCTGDNCAAELADALGARYVVTGRVDRFADRFLVNASIWDQGKLEVRVKSQREVKDAGQLPQAIDEIADELLQPFGIAGKVDVKLIDKIYPMGFNLGINLGTTFITSIVKLAPIGEIELSYRISLPVSVFLKIGFGITFDSTSNVGLTPGLLGAKYNFRSDKSFQPVLGGGIGILTTISAVQGRARPSLVLLTGVQYMFTQRICATMELNLDVLGLAYTFAETQKLGINLGLSLGFLYRF
jgi:hypothetical protein